MKILIALLCAIPFVSFAQFESIQDRIQKIEDFKTRYDSILEASRALKLEVESFSSPKLIKKDEIKLNNMKPHVSAIVRDLEGREYILGTQQLRQHLDELKKTVEEREEFKRNQKRLDEIQKIPGVTKRLEKYFASVNEGKSTQARVLLATLNAEEKGIAEAFDRAYTHVVQFRNVQEALDRKANDIRKKIDEKFFYAERGVEEFQGHAQAIAQERQILNSIKAELALDQYDFKFDTWQQGLFNCQDKPKYLRPINHPELLLLTNDGNLRSVIRLNPDKPNSFETVYKCKDVGSFGICRDDGAKELCRLNDNCRESLTQMEGAYQRNEFFQQLKATFPAKLIQDRKQLYLGSSQENLLQTLEDLGKLGLHSRAELVAFMDPIIEYLPTVIARNPEEYLRKVKLELEKQKKKSVDAVAKKFPGADRLKLDDTRNAINYIFTSMLTELERTQKDDVIQDYAAETCDGVPGREIFCQSAKDWKQKAGIFDEKTEVHNLLPKECTRVVLRMDSKMVGQGPVCLPMESEIDQLQESVQGIERELKK
jgi:hypothetical protein